MLRLHLVAIVLGALLLISGCAVNEPIVPAKIAEMVNEEGRERTYDLVWQDIRRFEGALKRGEQTRFDDQALIIVSRINRLAEGKASTMRKERYQAVLMSAQREMGMLGTAHRDDLLYRAAARLRIAFDDGAFLDAQKLALTALGYARALDTTLQPEDRSRPGHT